MKEAIEDLLKGLKITAGARFNAGKRLELHDRRLTILTASASAYVIALTVIPYFLPVPKHVSDTLNLITVVLSVVVLASSLLQYSSGNTVKAEQHHRSALEINELRRELKIKAERITESEFLDISDRYNSVLQKYSINHDDIDYQRYQLERREDFKWLTWRQICVMRAQQIIARYAPNIWLAVISGLFVWVVFFYARPAAKFEWNPGVAAITSAKGADGNTNATGVIPK